MAVSCSWCSHALHKHSNNPVDWCTLSPVWVEVASGHFCGQFSGGTEAATLRSADDNWAAWRRTQSDQQERAIKAEKALKAARAEIRKLKARDA